MNLIRHYVAGIVICVMLFAMFGGIYTGFKGHYGFTETYTGTNSSVNIADKVQQIGAVQAIQTFLDGVFTIINPSSSITDILGGLAVSAFGLLSTIFNLIFFPFQLFGVITGFYYIPHEVIGLIGILVAIYFAFIYLSARMKSDI